MKLENINLSIEGMLLLNAIGKLQSSYPCMTTQEILDWLVDDVKIITDALKTMVKDNNFNSK